MKRFVLCLLISLLGWSVRLPAAPREAEWKQVEELVKAENYQGAGEVLESIETAAMADKSWAEAAKAIGGRIVLESIRDPNQPDLQITRMEAAIAKAPAEMLTMLQTIQAAWYYEYFAGQRSEIMDRTPAAGGTGTDITTWDLRRILTEVDARFQKVLAASAELQKRSVSQWDGLLEKGGLPDSYQPTLYDFIARQALAFYTAAEQAGAVPLETFSFADDSPALGRMEEFLAWQPGEGNSPEQRGIRLYQALLQFHIDDADPGARVLLDIERLEWAAATATGSGATQRLQPQLTALYQQHAAHEVSLRARAGVAKLLIESRKLAVARTILKDGVAAFEKSHFAPRCRNYIKEIEQKELSVGTESIWNAAGPEIAIVYRNITKVFFRLYLVSDKPEPPLVATVWDDEDEMAKIMKTKKAARTWATDLQPTDDFLERKHREPAPADVKPGFYILAASGDEAFSEVTNVIAITPLWVSPLAMVTRERRAEDGLNAIDAWVLDAVSGDPVNGAEVSTWMEKEQGKDEAPPDPFGGLQAPRKGQSLKTGTDGFVSFQPKVSGWLMLFASRGDDTAFSGEMHSGGPANQRSDKTTSTQFFTDRAIYRPGQTIQFKGIHFHHDTSKKDYRTLPDVKRRVVLKDANGRELAAKDIVTNAFGSFSGNFTAPQHGLTGRLEIGDGDGAVSVRAEEYKRPKFRVEIDPPAAAPKLDTEVTVKVKALAYSGAAVDGAAVKWRVSRDAQWPEWVRGSWWFEYSSGREQEVAHGESTTGADGSVEVKFAAVPDKTIEEQSEPWFRYTIHADVTDTAGETRSGDRTVTAGYAALRAELTADDWQSVAEPVKVEVRTTTLDGEPQKAEGTLVVHRLVPPDKVYRPSLDDFVGNPFDSSGRFVVTTAIAPERDLSDCETWDTGEVVQRNPTATDDKGNTTVAVKLAAGGYRAILETADRFGKKVTAQLTFLVVDAAAEKFPVKIPFWTGAPAREFKPGDDFTALWGSGYDKARAFVEIEHRGKIVQRFWSDAARTQQSVPFKVTEEHRGGFTVHFIQMRENRLSHDSMPVSVRWTSKELKLKWEHLTSMLEPGAKDTWTLKIEGHGGEKAAEMVAALYDASLDAFASHEWPRRFDCFNESFAVGGFEFANGLVELDEVMDEWKDGLETGNESGRHWPWGRTLRAGFGAGFGAGRGASVEYGGIVGRGGVFFPPGPALSARVAAAGEDRYSSANALFPPALPFDASGQRSLTGAVLTNVTARRNMQETACFFPHLTSTEEGAVKMTFTMPEAVTTWKFLGFAHDKELRSGFIGGETITAKDLMVQPNAPRFLREGDSVEFTVKITNMSDAPQAGMARLNLSDATTLGALDAAAGIVKPEQPFNVPGKESRTISWRLTVPEGHDVLTWKAVAATEKLSDGEEGWLPVLRRRILVSESLPLNVHGAGTKEFSFQRLKDSAGSESLRHHSLTVQAVSNPAWYAVMALPYLMEFPHECSEQTFNRFYANALARHIAGSDPKIRRTFDLWRDTAPDATASPLVKNPELKSVLIEETPWFRDAQNETEQRRNVGILFDDYRLDNENGRLLQQLDAAQLNDGSWPWFPGGRGNDFITLYILAGFGRLQHLGVPVKIEPALEALDRLDAWLSAEHARIAKDQKNRDADHFDSSIALYLYARSFFLEQRPVPAEHKAAVDYFLAQARKYWPGKGRMTQAHAALGLFRFGDRKAATSILESLKGRSLMSEDQGRHWADGGDAWRWDAAPVEAQALMIECFREIASDTTTADECLVWLLKQKQTRSWSTSKATADAVYALLAGGTGVLTSETQAVVSLGGNEVKPDKTEAGTGFFAKTFTAAEIKPAMSDVKLVKSGKGGAWGSVHWQYFEDLSKVTPHGGAPLKVTKALFTKVNTDAGPELRPVTGKVKVGDELVVRLELRSDRDMEFVHLKDQRPSSVEPVNVLSEYKWQDGLGYYESTRDTASHFFFESLPRGTYVFEYSARVQLRGHCESGLATLQCMYAPEFSSHSAGAMLEVE